MSDPSTADVLRKARELYAANPSHAPRNVVPPAGDHCVVTAIGDVAWDQADFGSVAYNDATAAFRRAIGGGSTICFNAENSTETVLAAFDKAIELAERAS